MSVNVLGGQPNAVVCGTAVSFASAGITSGNTSIIYKVGNPLLSYVPGRAINGITGFELNAGYYIVAISDMDLTAYLVPPVSGGGGGGYTFVNTEASAYFARLATAGYASNNTEKGAYDAFVTSAKANSYYTKLQALYIFLGAADTPRLLNAITSSYNGVKHGGVTFSSAGAIFDGTSGYIDTTLTPSTAQTANNTSFGCWTLNNLTEASSKIMGAASLDGNQYTLIPKFTDGKLYSVHYNTTTANVAAFTNSDGSGFYISSRTSSSLLTVYRNGTSLGTNVNVTSAVPPAFPMYLGALSAEGTGAIQFSANTIKMAFIGSGLSSADATAFNTALGTLMTALGR